MYQTEKVALIYSTFFCVFQNKKPEDILHTIDNWTLVIPSDL